MSTPSVPQPAPHAFSLHLSADQRSLLEAVRRYTHERLLPLLSDSANTLERQEALRTATQLGLASAVLPEHRDGLGIGALELCLLLEELAIGPLSVAAEITASVPALAISRELEMVEQLIPPDAESLIGGGRALLLSVAAPCAETTFVLVPPCEACLLILLPPDSEGNRRLRRIAQDVLSAMPDNTAGEHLPPDMRLARLSVTPPEAGPYAETLLPRQAGEHVLIWQGLWLATLLTGAARAATDFAFSYAQTRVAFLRPIIHHQAVALRLADMAIITDIIRLLIWDAATRFSSIEGLSQAGFAQTARHVVAASLEVHRHAVQVCAGHGYVEGFPPARRFQDARLLSLLLLDVTRALQSRAAPARREG